MHIAPSVNIRPSPVSSPRLYVPGLPTLHDISILSIGMKALLHPLEARSSLDHPVTYSFYSAPHHHASPRPASLSFCTWTLTTTSMRCIALLPADVSSCGFYPLHPFVCCLPACAITYFVSGIYTHPPPSTAFCIFLLLVPTYLPALRLRFFTHHPPCRDGFTTVPKYWSHQKNA